MKSGSNVVILGKPLMKKSWKIQLQEKMDKIGNLNNESKDKHKEQIQEYSREPYYD
jgi:hypothetical protein